MRRRTVRACAALAALGVAGVACFAYACREPLRIRWLEYRFRTDSATFLDAAARPEGSRERQVLCAFVRTPAGAEVLRARFVEELFKLPLLRDRQVNDCGPGEGVRVWANVGTENRMRFSVEDHPVPLTGRRWKVSTWSLSPFRQLIALLPDGGSGPFRVDRFDNVEFTIAKSGSEQCEVVAWKPSEDSSDP